MPGFGDIFNTIIRPRPALTRPSPQHFCPSDTNPTQVALPIFYASGSRRRALVWSCLTGVTEPIGGIIGYLLLQPIFTDIVFGVTFAFVGGMMIFISLHELIPTAHRYLPDQTASVTFCVLVGMAIMAASIVVLEFSGGHSHGASEHNHGGGHADGEGAVDHHEHDHDHAH